MQRCSEANRWDLPGAGKPALSARPVGLASGRLVLRFGATSAACGHFARVERSAGMTASRRLWHAGRTLAPAMRAMQNKALHQTVGAMVAGGAPPAGERQCWADMERER